MDKCTYQSAGPAQCVLSFGPASIYVVLAHAPVKLFLPVNTSLYAYALGLNW